jgi:hypothetical protein
VAKSRRPRFRLTGRRKQALAWLVVPVVFAIALIAWSAGPTDHDGTAGGGNVPTVLTSPIFGGLASAPASTPGSGGPSGSGTATAGPTDIFAALPNLPTSRNVNQAGLPERSVVFTATSDRPILRLGYKVLYGHPDHGSATNVSSPAEITTVARGYGLVAALGVQASPIATYTTCTVTVDGKVHSKHTVYGGFRVVVCVG